MHLLITLFGAVYIMEEPISCVDSPFIGTRKAVLTSIMIFNCFWFFRKAKSMI